jgi:hypothetical protein
MSNLIIIETIDKEAYISSGGRLRDIMGASELIRKVGTSFVQEVIQSIPGLNITPFVSEHGKTVLWSDSPETSEKFIEKWSEIVIERAPGIAALAAYSDISFDKAAPLNAENGYRKALRDAQQKLDRLKTSQALGVNRFQRIPVVAPCDFSAFPAAEVLGDRRVSQTAKAKIAAWENSNHRDAADKLQEAQWLGIIRATIQGLENFLTGGGETYTSQEYQRRSENLAAAWNNVFTQPNVVPLAADGDEFAAVLDGRNAIRFAAHFLEKLQKAVEGILPVPVSVPGTGTNLVVHVGVCVAKPSFPFSESYKLAGELLQSAQTQQASSAIDFHILYDSAAISLADIRKKLNVGDTCLTSKPFILGPTAPDLHSYARFECATEAIAASKHQTSGSRDLPISQAYGIREALFSEHRDMQETLWGNLMQKYGEFAAQWRKVVTPATLYQTEGRKHITYFLDALEASEFLQG